ncbi:MAG: nitroreductase family protein [Sphaerochaetaceae bacterium]
MDKPITIDLTKRRSIYALAKKLPVSEARIVELVEHAAKTAPSPFNSQSARMVILFGKEHDALWDIVLETLRKIVPVESFASTQQKIGSFRNGYGTVMFFDESATIEALGKQFPTFSATFPVWAQHANGMIQYAIWNLLANDHVGASLQHYNPLIDEAVHAHWNIPASWKLIAQMPFGAIAAPAGEKTSLPASERVKVYR